MSSFSLSFAAPSLPLVNLPTCNIWNVFWLTDQFCLTQTCADNSLCYSLVSEAMLSSKSKLTSVRLFPAWGYLLYFSSFLKWVMAQWHRAHGLQTHSSPAVQFTCPTVCSKHWCQSEMQWIMFCDPHSKSLQGHENWFVTAWHTFSPQLGYSYSLLFNRTFRNPTLSVGR